MSEQAGPPSTVRRHPGGPRFESARAHAAARGSARVHRELRPDSCGLSPSKRRGSRPTGPRVVRAGRFSLLLLRMHHPRPGRTAHSKPCARPAARARKRTGCGTLLSPRGTVSRASRWQPEVCARSVLHGLSTQSVAHGSGIGFEHRGRRQVMSVRFRTGSRRTSWPARSKTPARPQPFDETAVAHVVSASRSRSALATRPRSSRLRCVDGRKLATRSPRTSSRKT